MAHKYDHIREKALELRIQHNMTLDEIAERMNVSRTTVYYWIKDHPLEEERKRRSEKRQLAQKRAAEATKAKWKSYREEGYEKGLAEAPELFKDETLKTFVILYTAEGYRRNHQVVHFGNSDPWMMKIAQYWMPRFTENKLEYKLQIHVDQDEEELRQFWGKELNIDPGLIKVSRKSNSGKLKGRKWRSKHGVMSIGVGDVYFRARLQGWIDFLKSTCYNVP